MSAAGYRDGSGLYLPASLVEERALERARALLRQEGPPVVFHSGGAFPLRGLGHQPSHAALLEELKGWPAIAANRIADRVSSLEPSVVVRRRTADGTLAEEELDDHPARQVLEQPTGPGGIFSWRLLARLATFHLLQTGEAYWQKLRDGLGVVRELWPMPPQHVVPIGDSALVISGYEVTDGGGRVQRLPRSEVIRFWWPDPETLYTSRGVLGPQATEHDALRFLAEHLREHFANDATPRVVLKAGEKSTPFSKPERDTFYGEWRERYARRVGRNRGLPAFLPTGFDVEEFSAHGGTTELVPLEERWAEQILAAYGVPGSIAGLVADVNRAAAETNQFVFDQHTVKPITDLLAEVLTDQFAREYDPALRVRYPDFVAADKDFELRREESDVRNKVRSPQQILRDRRADPEDAPWGEFPPGSIADVPYTGEIPEDTGEESAADLEAPRGAPAAPRARAEPVHRAEAFAPDAAFARLLAAERRFAGPFARAMARVFETQRRDVVKALRAQVPRGLARVSADDLFVPARFAALFERVVEPVRRRVFTSGGREAAELLDSSFSVTAEATRRLERLGAAMRVQVDRVTRERLARQLAAGTAAGESVDQLARRIESVFGDRKRGRTIARTEVGTAHQQGQLESFRQSGVVTGKRWNTSRDDAVRDSHADAEGQEVPLDADFELGSGARAEAPLDPSLPAEDRINCRCFVTPVLEGK